MKRRHNNDSSSAPKRRKVNLHGLFIYQRHIAEVHDGDVAGYLTGRVISVRDKLKNFTLELLGRRSSSGTNIVDVEFGKQRKEEWARTIRVMTGDKMDISLKGVARKKVNKDGLPRVLLCFADGITYKLLERDGMSLDPPAGRIVNIWPNSTSAKSSKRSEDSWYSTPDPEDDVSSRSSHDSEDMTSDVMDASTPATSDNFDILFAGSSNQSKFLPPVHSSESARTKGMLNALPQGQESILVHPVQKSGKRLPDPPVSRLQSGHPRTGDPVGPPPASRTSNGRRRKASKHPQQSPVSRTASASHDQVASSSSNTASNVSGKRPDTATATPPVGFVVDRRTEATAILPGGSPRRDPTPSTRHDAETSISTHTHGNTTLPRYPPAAFIVPPGYSVLSDISQMKVDFAFSVIAVVTYSGSMTESRTGDWQKRLHVVDPLSLDRWGGPLYSNGSGVRIDAFAKSHRQWLPDVPIGSIVILRDLKIATWSRSKTVTGYKDKLKWAIYDPSTGQATHGEIPNHIPSSDPQSAYSPFWRATPDELAYCAQLAEWWRYIQAQRKKAVGTEVHIDAPSVKLQRKGREHRLICEMHPAMEPQGYCDCTVEILFVHDDDDGNACSVFVTDYTSNGQTYRPAGDREGAWCHRDLRDKVLQVEMFEEARELGKHMKQGQFWMIRNLRVKASMAGFYEGGFKEAKKATLLDETTKDSEIPAFKELLERRRKWKEGCESETDAASYGHQLLSDAAVEKMFTGTVEVISCHPDPAGNSVLYVSDYSKRDNLLPPPPSIEGASDRVGMILKVELRDRQNQAADYIYNGCICEIRGLRLREAKADNNRLFARLAGHAKLIRSLNPEDRTNENVVSLLNRKEAWKNTTLRPERMEARRTPQGKTLQPAVDKLVTIKELLEVSQCPRIFSLNARVLKMTPTPVENCYVRTCSLCHSQLPDDLDKCESCGDKPEASVIERYALAFLLQDEAGSTLRVILDQESKPLRGFPPVNFWQNEDIGKQLRSRLRPFAGNLLDSSKGTYPLEKLDTVFQHMRVESRLRVRDGKRVYVLR